MRHSLTHSAGGTGAIASAAASVSVVVVVAMVGVVEGGDVNTGGGVSSAASTRYPYSPANTPAASMASAASTIVVALIDVYGGSAVTTYVRNVVLVNPRSALESYVMGTITEYDSEHSAGVSKIAVYVG